ncbi:zinc protease [Chelatococcus caeni]|uniref:Zinc protease n=1 Tax=Chelatococcus caeni TaxID=1348468 RepID=A0A840BY40_9HYPH|nr:pitrilysin family protein [Chelatococcus caeni]MBB4015197.1 zinc protease [Chelatococcus caeni]
MTTSAVTKTAEQPSRATHRVQRVVSPGGIEAWLVEEHAVPLVALEFAFLGGTAQDGAGKGGTATMLAGLLDEGAGPYDSAAFQQMLADRAIELRFYADRDTLRGSLKSLRRNADEAFDLLRLAVCEPRFDADAIARVRAQVEAGLRHVLKDPDAVSQEQFFRHAFPGHPYGRPPQGTLAEVPAITREDIAGMRSATVARSNLFVTAVGAIDAETLAARLDEIFGALPATAEVAPPADIVPATATAPVVVDIDVPQSVIRFGGPGVARRDADYLPAYVLNHILGGGAFTSRLFQEVREKRGLAYGVHTALLPLRNSTLFTGSTATKNERAAESLSVIRAEIADLLAKGPGEDELEKARQFLIGSYALHFDTSTKIARQLLQIAIDGLGIDYIDRRNDLVAAVTMADVRRAAERLFAGGEMLVVAVGRPEGL